jgi:hypothetical protein
MKIRTPRAKLEPRRWPERFTRMGRRDIEAELKGMEDRDLFALALGRCEEDPELGSSILLREIVKRCA